MTQSIDLRTDPSVQYLLRLGDTCLVHSQRLSQWCGHAPVLEEDIALANMALDLLGQARALLSRAGELEGQGFDEDQIAFLRRERDYLNATLVELPDGPDGVDFAHVVVRNTFMATWYRLMWQRLAASNDEALVGIAAKAVKEARYHQRHAADWLARLGDGTDESAARVQAALGVLWPYTRELFDADAVDEHAVSSGLGPRWSDLQDDWLADIKPVFDAAKLPLPPEAKFRSDGKRGRHSEHMGYLLTELQYLQRTYPNGVW